MPNHVINELIFRGVSETEKVNIIAATCNAKSEVDFEVLVPMPLNMWWGDVGREHERAFGSTGLGWARQNWGTKWNAYGHVPIEQPNDVLALRFQTAWSPPYPWLAAVLNRLALPFDHNWLDEGAVNGWCGTFKQTEKHGPEWAEQPAPEYMQRHLHKLLWGVEQFEDEDDDDSATQPGDGGRS